MTVPTPDPADPLVLVGWVTRGEVSDLWEDSDLLETAALDRVLRTAHEDAVDYLRDATGAYTEPEPADIPERWKTAQIMLARHIWARMRTGNSDSYGPDGLALSTYPLVLEARAQLRPKRNPWAGLL